MGILIFLLTTSVVCGILIYRCFQRVHATDKEINELINDLIYTDKPVHAFTYKRKKRK